MMLLLRIALRGHFACRWGGEELRVAAEPGTKIAGDLRSDLDSLFCLKLCYTVCVDRFAGIAFLPESLAPIINLAGKAGCQNKAPASAPRPRRGSGGG